MKSKSGTHRDDGIFLTHGPTIHAGLTVDRARIIDLAPTILTLLDVPVPDGMDGRVLTEILTQAPAQRFAVQQVGEPASHTSSGSNGVYQSEDTGKIAQGFNCQGTAD
jgi:hypothetical protein